MELLIKSLLIGLASREVARLGVLYVQVRFERSGVSDHGRREKKARR